MVFFLQPTCEHAEGEEEMNEARGEVAYRESEGAKEAADEDDGAAAVLLAQHAGHGCCG